MAPKGRPLSTTNRWFSTSKNQESNSCSVCCGHAPTQSHDILSQTLHVWNIMISVDPAKHSNVQSMECLGRTGLWHGRAELPRVTFCVNQRAPCPMPSIADQAHSFPKASKGPALEAGNGWHWIILELSCFTSPPGCIVHLVPGGPSNDL